MVSVVLDTQGASFENGCELPSVVSGFLNSMPSAE